VDGASSQMSMVDHTVAGSKISATETAASSTSAEAGPRPGGSLTAVSTATSDSAESAMVESGRQDQHGSARALTLPTEDPAIAVAEPKPSTGGARRGAQKKELAPSRRSSRG
jgi:hypothetical protein